MFFVPVFGDTSTRGLKRSRNRNVANPRKFFCLRQALRPHPLDQRRGNQTGRLRNRPLPGRPRRRSPDQDPLL